MDKSRRMQINKPAMNSPAIVFKSCGVIWWWFNNGVRVFCANSNSKKISIGSTPKQDMMFLATSCDVTIASYSNSSIDSCAGATTNAFGKPFIATYRLHPHYTYPVYDTACSGTQHINQLNFRVTNQLLQIKPWNYLQSLPHGFQLKHSVLSLNSRIKRAKRYGF